MKMNKFFGILAFATLLALGLTFAACSSGDSAEEAEVYAPLRIEKKADNGKLLVIEITTTRTVPKAITLTPANGDSYVMWVDNVEVSRGTILVSGRNLTFNSSDGKTFYASYDSANDSLNMPVIPGPGGNGDLTDFGTGKAGGSGGMSAGGSYDASRLAAQEFANMLKSIIKNSNDVLEVAEYTGLADILTGYHSSTTLVVPDDVSCSGNVVTLKKGATSARKTFILIDRLEVPSGITFVVEDFIRLEVAKVYDSDTPRTLNTGNLIVGNGGKLRITENGELYIRTTDNLTSDTYVKLQLGSITVASGGTLELFAETNFKTKSDGESMTFAQGAKLNIGYLDMAGTTPFPVIGTADSALIHKSGYGNIKMSAPSGGSDFDYIFKLDNNAKVEIGDWCEIEDGTQLIVSAGSTLTIPADTCFEVAGTLTVDGASNNPGKVILKGSGTEFKGAFMFIADTGVLDVNAYGAVELEAGLVEDGEAWITVAAAGTIKVPGSQIIGKGTTYPPTITVAIGGVIKDGSVDNAMLSNNFKQDSNVALDTDGGNSGIYTAIGEIIFTWKTKGGGTSWQLPQ